MPAYAKSRSAAFLIGAQILLGTVPVNAADTRNLTGLPAYPNLSHAIMDSVFHTDTLGHWCMRFWAATSDPLTVVESWYEKAMAGASEIDLRQDKFYKHYAAVVGVKLVLGIDYAVVYKTTGNAATSIDLYRCSPIERP